MVTVDNGEESPALALVLALGYAFNILTATYCMAGILRNRHCLHVANVSSSPCLRLRTMRD